MTVLYVGVGLKTARLPLSAVAFEELVKSLQEPD
jgi:hypothetical protein